MSDWARARSNGWRKPGDRAAGAPPVPARVASFTARKAHPPIGPLPVKPIEVGHSPMAIRRTLQRAAEPGAAPLSAEALQAIIERQAQAVGINPAALTGTARVESTFGTDPVAMARFDDQGRLRGYLGVFQMGDAAYDQGMEEVQRRNPMLYDQLRQKHPYVRGKPVTSVDGRLDPETEAAASAGYTAWLANELKKRGVDTTFMNVRGAYNYYLDIGRRIASAPDDALMSHLLRNDTYLHSNHLSDELTVGKWRAAIIRKLKDINPNLNVFK